MKSASQKLEKRTYRVILLVVVGLGIFSSIIRELNQVHRLALETGKLVVSLSDVVIPTANAGNSPKIEVCEDNRLAVLQERSDEFRWNGIVARGNEIEIKGINGAITAEPAVGDEVQVVAFKKARRSDINSVELKVEQHAGGVTICALYPSEDSPNTCEPGPGRGNQSVRNNDVRVDFLVKVPERVGFVGKTVNGKISAKSLSSNVVTNTVNGSIEISTTGYAEAATINGAIAAKLGDIRWPKSLSFTTLNGQITLDLPAITNADVEAKTMNGAINSDFPLEVTQLKNRKELKGRIGRGGRGLQLKTLNGSINLRIAS